jgi:hypothetical protein
MCECHTYAFVFVFMHQFRNQLSIFTYVEIQEFPGALSPELPRLLDSLVKKVDPRLYNVHESISKVKGNLYTNWKKLSKMKGTFK